MEPYWTGETAKEDAIGYAKARANFKRGVIQVLDADGSIERVIQFLREKYARARVRKV